MPIKIPLIGGGGTFDGGGASGNWVGSVSSYAVTNLKAKVNEAAASVIKANAGSFGNYVKMGANAKSVVEMQARAIIERGVISPNGAPTLPINKTALGDLSFLGGQPPEAQVSAADMQTVNVRGRRGGMHRVTLEEIGGFGNDTIVVFDVLPEIVETHAVEYEAVAPPQFPGAFQKYKGNSSTQWQLNATFISRTTEEATRNYRNLMKLRGWTKPFYGTRTGESFSGKLGAPPPVLKLRGLRDLVGPVPVVIVALNWNWPKDVDYIATDVPGPDGKPVPFPVVMAVPIQLVESYSIVQFNNFSLADYRRGDLDAAFLAPASETPDASSSTTTAPVAAAPDASGNKAAAVSATPILPSAGKPEPTVPVDPKLAENARLSNEYDTKFGEMYTMSQVTPRTPATEEALRKKKAEVAELRLQMRARGITT